MIESRAQERDWFGDYNNMSERSEREVVRLSHENREGDTLSLLSAIYRYNKNISLSGACQHLGIRIPNL